MPYAASHSIEPNLDSAIQAVCHDVREQLTGQSPNLCFLFASHAHADGFEDLPATIRRELGADVLLGCSGETIVGGGEEIEEGPALSLWAGVMPGAMLMPFHIEFGETPDGLIAVGFPDDLPERAADARCSSLSENRIHRSPIP